MQGIKSYEEKFFVDFRLSERVPKDNFYRKLRETLDLTFLRKMTQKYYGTEGQKSIDTEVFFKLMLIGYLENINSDRKIVETAGMRMDMLFFLGYDIDEPLPWHSTLSRTRQLFGKEVFLELFRNILKICVEKGMVSGKTQAIDSAFIKANAAMDSLVERELNEKSKQFFTEITENEEEKTLIEKGKKNKKHSDLFVSSTDPDARVSQKQGKLPALNHLGIISVDTANHVICGAMAEFADKHDSATTEKIISQAIENLQDNNLQIEEVLADTGYSSGESYQFLEENAITAYIPPVGAYKPEKDGFIYEKEADCYVCSQGKKLTFKGVYKNQSRYESKKSDCKNCPLRAQCVNKRGFKSVYNTAYKEHFENAYKLLNTRRGKRMMRLRASTVEPVWGTLLHYRRLKKVYTIGNELANKQVLMAATAYNLKKLLAFDTLKKAATIAIKATVADIKLKISRLCELFYPNFNRQTGRIPKIGWLCW